MSVNEEESWKEKRTSNSSITIFVLPKYFEVLILCVIITRLHKKETLKKTMSRRDVLFQACLSSSMLPRRLRTSKYSSMMSTMRVISSVDR